MYALIGTFEVLKMLAAICHQAQKSAARVFVLAILIQMSRKLFDTSGQNSNLHLGRSRVGVMAAGFADLVAFLALRKHDRNDITFLLEAQEDCGHLWPSDENSFI